MICEKCKKRPAIVFLSSPNSPDDTKPHGYCLSCAKEMGIKPVNDLMEKMGITETQIDDLYEQMSDMFGSNGDIDFSAIGNLYNKAFQDDGEEESEISEEKEDDDDDFAHGAPAFPFLGSIFNRGGDGGKPSGSSEPKDKKGSSDPKDFIKSRKDKDKRRYKHLNTYCENLTEKARNNKLDMIIGRDKEIGRVIQILSRRTKNNPCLIGEPGVGKTAIAEGLAQRIVSGNVPAKLCDKEIYLLDLTALVAGTQFRGQFEARIKGLTSEVKDHGNVILFIDEVHNLVGTGDS